MKVPPTMGKQKRTFEICLFSIAMFVYRRVSWFNASSMACFVGELLMMSRKGAYLEATTWHCSCPRETSKFFRGGVPPEIYSIQLCTVYIYIYIYYTSSPWFSGCIHTYLGTRYRGFLMLEGQDYWPIGCTWWFLVKRWNPKSCKFVIFERTTTVMIWGLWFQENRCGFKSSHPMTGRESSVTSQGSKLRHVLDVEYYIFWSVVWNMLFFPFSWEWNNHPNWLCL